MSPVAVRRPSPRAKKRRTGRHAGMRLSPWRVVLAVAVVVAVAGAGFAVPSLLRAQASWAPVDWGPRWFGGYFDVTAADAADMPQAASENVVLAFVVAAGTDQCTPSWGAAYSLGEAGGSLDLDRRIARMRQQGRDVAISFGGADNTELAVACTELDPLAAAYGAVLDRYSATLMDLDIEKDNLADAQASARRAYAVAAMQAERPGLDVWLTLPVGLDGLTSDALTVIDKMFEAGVDLAGINLMTMDFGADLGGRSMAQTAERALTAAHGQIGALVDRYHLDRDVWAMMGATPMIGQNDVVGEVFTLADAAQLNRFAIDRGMSRLSMWSLNRDRTCGPNYPNTRIVSNECSGVDQGDATFAAALAAGFEGRPDPSPAPEATAITPVPDDPATAPYPIWSREVAYSAGVKVVWHGSVYSAKWWTQGPPEPDDPTLADSSTPWTLVGPVLPDDPPYALPTLPAGTYPDWSATATYVAGDRVLFGGTPYAAKWWVQGESPADAATDRDRSSWRLLTG